MDDYGAEPILALAKEGLPLRDILVIDVHAHLGPCALMHIPNNDARGIVAVMDRAGVDRGCISSQMSIGPDYRRGNELVAQAIADFPARFVGYVTVNPYYVHDIVPELERWSGHEGMKAIKIHPADHRYPVNGTHYRPVFDWAMEHGLPVLSHTWGEGPEAEFCSPTLFGPLAEAYPNVDFILGHAGGTLLGYHRAVEVARKWPNIYLDLCGSFQSMGAVEYFVESIGVDRVLFGSDVPFLNLMADLGKVLYARLTTEEKKKILSLNAARLLKLEPWPRC
jgi:predicted TIM-barrel fold metal-dependent hydrolase